MAASTEETNNEENKDEDIYTFKAILSDLNINEENKCPVMYNYSWSQCLNDIVMNFLRKNGILTDFEDFIIPKSVYDVIAQFYSNDSTKYRSYNDYMNAILICKYFSSLKQIKSPLNENDINVKTKYKLTKKASLTTTKIFKALNDYKDKDKDKTFKIFNDKQIDNFQVLFIDHDINKFNLKKYSYPKDTVYNISSDELEIITAIRNQIKKGQDLYVDNDKTYKVTLLSKEMKKITQKGYFKTGKTSIKHHTIIEYRDKALFAVDYSFEYCYFLFVFRFFTIIIHDYLGSDKRHTTRTMEARVIANRYRGILQQFDESGL